MSLGRSSLLVGVVAVAVALLLVQAAGRELSFEKAHHELKARLETGMRQQLSAELGQLDHGTGGGWGECLNALYEIQSCTNEIVLFFLNGETYLGPDCCRAIREITHTCWPSMVVSVGFTEQEEDILRGYCDATRSLSSPPSLGPVAPGVAVQEQSGEV